MSRIIKIESARHMDGESWEVGKEIEFGSGKVVTELKDMGAEFQESIYVQFDIFVNNRLYKTLINMPVKVEYSLDD